MRPIPNLTIASPLNEVDLRNLMFTAAQDDAGTFVIRYPRGKGELHDWQQPFKILPRGKGRLLREGTDVAVLSIGPIGNNVRKAIEITDSFTSSEAVSTVSVAHYDMLYLKPIDEEILHEVGRRFKRVITVENGVRTGGLGSAVAEFMTEHGYMPRITRLGLPDEFVTHGTVDELYRLCGLDAESIADAIKN
jgi:1-deoxy-D-xylulose-5-phosphate synthase